MAVPLYPDVIVPVDAGASADSDLTAFIRRASAAGQALVQAAEGQVFDPAPLAAMMAADVEVFVGQGEDARDQDFVSLGRHGPYAALELVGRLSRNSDSADPLVQQRQGMRDVATILSDPTIGKTPWLGDRLCTAAYGRVSFPDWRALRGDGRLSDLDWVVAVDVGRDAPDANAAWPKRFQLVPVSPEQKAAGGWIGIIAPGGWTAFFRNGPFEGAGRFAPYLNNHVCFEKLGGVWKITALARRLD